MGLLEAAGLWHWLLMVTAMMLPLTMPAVREVVGRSVWRRRRAAAVAVVAGYGLVWLSIGPVVGWMAAFSLPTERPLWSAVFFVGAAGWSLTATKRRAEVACHKIVPLPAAGWRANHSVLSYGAQFGASCVVACGPTMVACALSAHAAPVTIAAASLNMLDRFRFRRPRPTHLAVGWLAIALLAALPAL